MDSSSPKEKADKVNTSLHRAASVTRDFANNFKISGLADIDTNLYKIFFVNIKRKENNTTQKNFRL